MAEPAAASSRTSVRMAIGFMTNDTTHDASSRGTTPHPVNASSSPTSRMVRDEIVRGNSTARPRTCPGTVREASGGGRVTVDISRTPTSADRANASETFAMVNTPGGGQGVVGAGGSNDYWPEGHADVAQGKGRRGERNPYFGAQIPASGEDFHSTAAGSTGAATPFVATGEYRHSPNLLPPMSAVSEVSHSPRDIRTASCTRGKCGHAWHESRQQFGVKRIRSLEEKDGGDDEQGGETRRVSSPHRLFRRSSNDTAPSANRAILSPTGFNPIVAVHQTDPGAGVTVDMRFGRTNADTDDAVRWKRRAGEIRVFGENDSRGRTRAACRDTGESRASCLGRAHPGANLFAVKDSQQSSPDRYSCRPRHRSLKVQRLNASPMDSLTNGVRTLGVVSPVECLAEVGNIGQSEGNGGAVGTEWVWPRPVAEDVPTPIPTPTAGQLSPVGRDADPADGRLCAGVGSTSAAGGQEQPVVPSESLGQVSPRFPVGMTFTRALSTLSTILPASATPITVTPPPPPIPDGFIDGRAQAQKLRTSKVRSQKRAGVTAMDVESGTVSGKGAPFYDAAVCTAGDGRKQGDAIFEAPAGNEDGDSAQEESSSDGDAAHEEISAWLHSTDDWWI